MSLSDVDKQRIYAEEKARFEAQKQLKNNDSISEWIVGIIVMVIIFAITWNILS
nr:hypothetical protein 16 [bacterium]